MNVDRRGFVMSLLAAPLAAKLAAKDSIGGAKVIHSPLFVTTAKGDQWLTVSDEWPSVILNVRTREMFHITERGLVRQCA